MTDKNAVVFRNRVVRLIEISVRFWLTDRTEFNESNNQNFDKTELKPKKKKKFRLGLIYIFESIDS